MYLEELSIQPAIDIRAALRIVPAVCVGFFPALILALTGVNAGSWITAARWAALLALSGLVLALIRLVVGRYVRLLCLTEIFIITALLLFIVYLGASALVEAYGTQSPTAVTLGVLLMMAGAFGIYRFMYPLRPDPKADPTVSQLLHGGSRPGSERTFSFGFGVSWLVLLFACLAANGMSARLLGQRVWAVGSATLAAALLARAILPALKSGASRVGFQTLRDLRAARANRRYRPYEIYLARFAEDWTRARFYLLMMVIFGGLAIISPFVRLANMAAPILAILAYTNYRQILKALAQSLPESATELVERTHDFTLYLRSFNDDDFRFDLAATGLRRFLFLPPAGAVYENSFRSSRLEELVVRTLWRYRPVVAAAGVDAPANPIGALPLRLRDEDWRAGILNRVAFCTTVVSVLGSTPGVVWEVRTLMEDPRARRRAIFLIPQDEPNEVSRRWHACFGMATSAPAGVIERAIVVKPMDDGHLLLITATRRTAAAYRMALDLAEGLVARHVEGPQPQLAVTDRM